MFLVTAYYVSINLKVMAWPLFYGSLGALSTGFTAMFIGLARASCVMKDNVSGASSIDAEDDKCDGLIYLFVLS